MMELADGKSKKLTFENIHICAWCLRTVTVVAHALARHLLSKQSAHTLLAVYTYGGAARKEGKDGGIIFWLLVGFIAGKASQEGDGKNNQEDSEAKEDR
jgi:hypothetical protein